MNANDCILTIEVNYKEKKEAISLKDIITLEDLRKKVIEKFGLPMEYEKYMKFRVINDNKIDYLKNEDDIIYNAIEIDPDNYNLKTELIIEKDKLKYDVLFVLLKKLKEQCKSELTKVKDIV